MLFLLKDADSSLVGLCTRHLGYMVKCHDADFLAWPVWGRVNSAAAMTLKKC